MQIELIDLGQKGFGEALDFQEKRVAERQANRVGDTLILVEHPPVYTLGRNADPTNVLKSEAELKQSGIALVRTTRGGQVTYHGPGQLVGYPILKLSTQKQQGVLWYVGQLENMLIKTLHDFGIESYAGQKDRGVWVGNDKIAALGVRVTRHVTMHGFALNVRVKLENYKGIVPCGIRDKGVTSMHKFVPDITLEKVKPVLIKSFKETFDET